MEILGSHHKDRLEEEQQEQEARRPQNPLAPSNSAVTNQEISLSRQETDISPDTVNMSVVHGMGSAAPQKDSMPLFPYRPLDASELEIRVVTLKPGSLSMPIECDLEHISTKQGSCPSYKALSYTWGAPEHSKTISLQGTTVSVRENLWQALRHLRSSEKELRLWIDAICINQTNIPERNQQVSRMGTLYGLTEEVIVWLGPESDDSHVAMSFISKGPDDPGGLKTLDVFSQAIHDSEFNAVLRLTEREYWRRIWVIQEIFKAPNITLHCGNNQVSWGAFVRFLNIMRRGGPAHSAQSFNLLAIGPATKISESISAKLISDKTSQNLNLETLVETYQDSLCCDPRDKIYSLLGLAEGNMFSDFSSEQKPHNWLKVDYGRSQQELFRILVLLYWFHDERGRLVKWMALLQKVLDLPAPWSVEWLNTQPHKSLLPSSGITQYTTFISTVHSVGPSWSPQANDIDLVRDWHSPFEALKGSRRWIYTEQLEQLDEDDTDRLQYFPIWETNQIANAEKKITRSRKDMLCPTKYSEPRLQIFRTTNGQLGISYCTVQKEDRILRFSESVVALLIRLGELKPRGRVFILNSRPLVHSNTMESKYETPDLADGTWVYNLIPGENLNPDQSQTISREEYRVASNKDSFLGKRSTVSLTMSLEEWQFWTW